MVTKFDFNADQTRFVIDANQQARQTIAAAAQQTIGGDQFVYFAAFDGTNNDRNHPTDPYQTNVGELWDQYEPLTESEVTRFAGRYFAGPGTEDTRVMSSWFPPQVTAQIIDTANLAYQDFADRAGKWLAVNPGKSVTVAFTAFSRGCASAAIFSQMLYERGLVYDGKVLIPPGQVGISAGVLFDPVTTNVNSNLAFAPNATNIVDIKALSEYRNLFRATDYSGQGDIVKTIGMYGNHCDIGGGYDNGTGVISLQAATEFLRQSGMSGLPDTARTFNANDVAIHSEQYADEGRTSQLWTADFDDSMFGFDNRRYNNTNAKIESASDGGDGAVMTLYNGHTVTISGLGSGFETVEVESTDASGAQRREIRQYQGSDSNASLVMETTAIVSADGKEVSSITNNYQDGILSKTEMESTDAFGVQHHEIRQYQVSGSDTFLVLETTATISADGRVSSSITNNYQDGILSKTEMESTDALGAQHHEIRQYQVSGSDAFLVLETIATVSADGKESSSVTKNYQDGALSKTENAVTRSTGLTTASYRCADGSYGESISYPDGSGQRIVAADESVSMQTYFSGGTLASEKTLYADGSSRMTSYSADGSVLNRIIQSVDGSSEEWRPDFWSKTNSDGSSTYTSYASMGVAEWDTEGSVASDGTRITSQRFRDGHRVVTQLNPDGSNQESTYSSDGIMQEVINGADGSSIKRLYFSSGSIFLVQIWNADGSRRETVYYEDGKLRYERYKNADGTAGSIDYYEKNGEYYLAGQTTLDASGLYTKTVLWDSRSSDHRLVTTTEQLPPPSPTLPRSPLQPLPSEVRYTRSDGAIEHTTYYLPGGPKKTVVVLFADGAWTSTSYFAGGALSEVDTYGKDGSVDRQTYYSSGILERDERSNADGSGVIDTHYVDGSLKSRVAKAVDGTINSKTYYMNGVIAKNDHSESDGSFHYLSYDAFGTLVADRWQNSDGSHGATQVGYDGTTSSEVTGTAGNDVLSSIAGNATFAGGAGNDTITAQGDNNTLIFNLGDGTDHVATGGSGNTLRLGVGIAADDLTLGLGSLALQIGADPNDVIHFESFDRQDVSSVHPIDRIVFADGSSLTYADLIARGFDITGTAGADVLLGTSADDRIEGGAGDDVLLGGEGNDTYRFGIGDGLDTVIDTQGSNAMLFTRGLAVTDVELRRVGDDLVVKLVANNDMLTVKDWSIAGGDWTLVFADGTVLNKEGIDARLNKAPSAQDDSAVVDEDAASVSGNVLANDTDPENAALRVTNPGTYSGSYGSLALTADGAYTYTPNSGAAQSLAVGQTVPERFAYEITDDSPRGALGSAAELVVEIVGANDAPTLMASMADVQVARKAEFSWQLPAGSFIDVDNGDMLSYSAELADGSALPTWLGFDAATQTLSGHVPANEKGSFDVRVTATDGSAASASDVFRITLGKTCDHGNEGVGNGEDAPPPGYHGNHNDGNGTSPGNPGSKGGRKDEDRDNDWLSKPRDGTDEDRKPTYLDPKHLDRHYADFDRGKGEADDSGYVRRWIEVDLAVSRWMAAQDKSLPDLHERKGADVSALHKAANGFLGSKTAHGPDPLNLAAGTDLHLKAFRGLNEGLQRLG